MLGSGWVEAEQCMLVSVIVVVAEERKKEKRCKPNTNQTHRTHIISWRPHTGFNVHLRNINCSASLP